MMSVRSFGIDTTRSLDRLRANAGVGFDEDNSETSTQIEVRLHSEAALLLRRGKRKEEVAEHVTTQDELRLVIREYQQSGVVEIDLGGWAAAKVLQERPGPDQPRERFIGKVRALKFLVDQGGYEVSLEHLAEFFTGQEMFRMTSKSSGGIRSSEGLTSGSGVLSTDPGLRGELPSPTHS